MPNIRRILLLLPVLSSLSPSLNGQTKIQPIHTSDTTRAFDAGETLTMTIQYRCAGIRSDVGHATFTISEAKAIDGRRTFTADAKGCTVPFFDRFFKVRDFYQSRFFADNGRPLHFHRSIYEGGYALTNNLLWNTNTEEIDIYNEYISSGRIKDTLITGDRSTYDVLSIAYAARNIDYDAAEPGTAFPYTFIIDEEKYDIHFRLDGRQVRKIPGMGVFRVLRISAKVVEGEVFDGDNEITMYVTDDRNHMPLWIESPIIIGSVLARLTAFRNIKHPLDSKLK